MKKIIHIVIYGIALALISMNMYAEEAKAVDNTVGSSKGDYKKVGAAGAQFLKIPVGARGAAMSANVASANDLSSIWWNPAGVASVKSFGGYFSNTWLFADCNQLFAGVSIPVGEQFVIAASMNSFTTGNIEYTTIHDDQGTNHFYQVSDFAAGLTLAGNLTEDFSFGVNMKYIYQSFSSLNSNGIGFDVGALYKTGLYGINIGFALSNLGTEMQYTGQDLQTLAPVIKDFGLAPIDAEFKAGRYTMPLVFRAGISSEFYKNCDHAVTGAFDFITASDISEQFAIGVEYTFRDIISLRAGYLLNNDQYNVSGGIGFKYNLGGNIIAGVDYSINPTKDLGIVNRLNLKLGL